MSKFTKGKWRCNDGTKIGVEELFVDVAMAGVVCRLTKQVDTHIPLSDEDIANAHLIAAAPDMYQAIEELIRLGTELLSLDEVVDEEDAATIHSNFNDKVLVAEKLLTKARGES